MWTEELYQRCTIRNKITILVGKQIYTPWYIVLLWNQKIEKENLEAMDRLLTEQESTDKRNQNRYRYYADLYGNEYCWTTHPQEDGNGKFKATIMKARTSSGWLRFKQTKKRYFVKRKTAKAWCLKHCLKANKHQKIVLDARADRKQQRLDAKPKYTKSEVSIQEAQKHITHYNTLVAKADTRIKRANTRKKTYLKRIKYYQKRIVTFI